ncbi:hypothetical protein [Curtobacterium sp. Curtsp57]|uniref:hypothetical protein n=1 Tax=Curtobacterium sp. Curtsp57 TaxID=3243047 RepID=UPI0039B6359B
MFYAGLDFNKAVPGHSAGPLFEALKAQVEQFTGLHLPSGAAPVGSPVSTPDAKPVSFSDLLNGLLHDETGSITVEALNLGSVARILKGVGVVGGAAAVVWDVFATAHEVAERFQAGDRDGALDLIGEYSARNVGGILGGIAGEMLASAAIGLMLAAFELTPVGWAVTLGVFIGAGIGALVGSQIGEDLYESFSDLMNALFSGDLSDWLNGAGPFYTRPIDPLVLDLDGDGLDVIDLAHSNAHFDLNDNGLAEKTAWIGSDDGFLALDSNGNGRIDGINELFGNETTDGFQVLAKYDDNKDGVIDANDAIYDQLKVWRDLDGDGVTDVGELTSLRDAGVASINLQTSRTGEWVNGNLSTESATYTKADGTAGKIADIWFQNDQVHTVDPNADTTPVSATAKQLPHLTGFGTVLDLSHALDANPALMAALTGIVTGSSTASVQEIYTQVEQFLLTWAGADTATPGTRGDMDAVHAAFLEAVHGTTYLNQAKGAITGNSATALETYYQSVMHTFVERLAAQLPASAAALAHDSTLIDAHPLAVLSAALFDQQFATAGVPALILEHTLTKLLTDIPATITSSTQIADVLHVFETLQTFAPAMTSGGTTLTDRILTAIEQHPLDTGTAALITALKNGAHLVTGGTGNDTITAHGNTPDLIIGGTGNDHINGGDGNDTYLWNPGDGHDTIADTGNTTNDTLNINGVTPDQITIERFANGDITIHINTPDPTNAGSITLAHSTNYGTGIETLNINGTTYPINTALAILNGIWEGGDADDTIYGYNGNDRIDGGAGNDTINGGDGDDILIGGTGDDILTGGAGSDTYVWSRGDGNDTIVESGYNDASTDTLVLHGVTLADLQVNLHDNYNETSSYYYSGDAIVTVKESAPGAGDGGVITMPASLLKSDGYGTGVEQIRLDDGTVLTRADIQQLSLRGGADSDTIYGFSSNDTITGGAGDDYLNGQLGNDRIDGGAGNDTINGGDGDDILIGGTGDDILTGGAGSDAYVWSRGDGNDTIVESDYNDASTDTLKLHGVTAADVSVNLHSVYNTSPSYSWGSSYAGDVVLTVKESAPGAGDGATITLNSSLFSNNTGGGVEQVVFDDGTTWTREDFQKLSLIGGDADDTIYGYNGNDTITGGAGDDYLNGQLGNDRIDGGAGNDTINGGDGDDILIGGTGDDILTGGAGSDTYVWSRGDGNDTIVESGYNDASTDTLVLHGVMLADLQVNLHDNYNETSSYYYSGDAIVTVKESAPGAGDGGVITMPASLLKSDGYGTGVEQIRLDDGTVLTRADIQQLSLRGGADSDTIYGFSSNDTITGGAGDDYLNGQLGNDRIDGGAGNDTINGGDGDDILIGGTGDDILTGGAGSDTYVWSRGDGNDTIVESDYNDASTDTLKLHGVTAADVSVNLHSVYNTSPSYSWGSSYAGDVVLTVKESAPGAGDGATITLNSSLFSNNTGGGVEQVVFDDGTTWTREDFQKLSLIGGDADDTIYGYNGNDTITGGAGDDYLNGQLGNDRIDGGAGNDTINGGDGDDILIGGTGDDILTGGAGSDTYVWSRGDGNDTIVESGYNDASTDTLVLHGVTLADLQVNLHDNYNETSSYYYSGDAIVTVKESAPGAGDGGVITMPASLLKSDGYGTGVEQIRLDDGTVLTRADIQQLSLRGGADSDTIYGFSSNDTITGGAGDDYLNGQLGNDRIDGGAGNDTINGGDGDDILIGGTGDDILTGGAGSDTYVWSRGDGNDTIVESDYNDASTDTLKLHGVTAADVSVNLHSVYNTSPSYSWGSSYAGDVVLTVKESAPGAGDGATITLNSSLFSNNTGGGVEQVVFDDGTTWTREDFQKLSLIGGDADDTIYGYNGNDTITGGAGDDYLNGQLGNDRIDGGAGNDTINGGDGDDILIGGTGDDILTGGAGSDTYVWSRGDGNDTIVESDYNDASTDTLKLHGVTAADVSVNLHSVYNTSPSYSWGSSYAGDVVLTVKESAPGAGDGATITLNSSLFSNNTGGGVEQVVFDDGTTWTREDFQKLSLIGGDADDTIYGYNGNDTITGGAGDDYLNGQLGNDRIDGGAGNDTINGGDGDDILIGGTGDDILTGGAGSDTYVWSRGDGNDTIVESGYNDASTDTLVLHGVMLADLQVNLHDNYNETSSYYYSGDAIVTVKESAPGAGDGGVITMPASLLKSDGYGTGVEQIRLDDGTVLTRADIQQLSLRGGADSDTIYGFSSNDTITGGAGDDYLNGQLGNDRIDGGAGNDTINGGDGDDILIGGTGDDILTGGAGSDTYVWSRGDGNDTIVESDYNDASTDTLKLHGVTAADVSVNLHSVYNTSPSYSWGSSYAGDVVLTVKESAPGAGDGATITLNSSLFSNNTGGGVEQVVFDDGTTWTREDFQKLSLIGGDADDTIYGYNGNDRIDGGAGNDTINGGDGDDILIGGTGDDILTGGAGSDTYVWSRGDGNDTIVESGYNDASTDTLVLHGVTLADLQVNLHDNYNETSSYYYSGDAIVTVKESAPGAGDGGVITMPASLLKSDGYGTGVEQIRLDDGTVLTRADIQQLSLRGGADSDTIYGFSSNDTITGGAGDDYLNGQLGNDRIDGGAGNDTINGGDGDDILIGGTGDDILTGGAGSDTYVWSRGDGNDTIVESGYNDASTDTLVLHGVTLADLQVNLHDNYNETSSYYYSGDAIVTVKESAPGAGDGGVITMPASLLKSDGYGTGVEQIRLDDGTVLTRADIQQLSLRGGADSDTIYGFSSNDTITGGAGDDYLNGQLGNDRIDGGAGNDTINGGDGDDILIGGTGDDILTGGAGNDTFVFELASGNDRITDFASAASGGFDVIDLTAWQELTFDDLIAQAEDTSNGAVLHLDPDNSFTLDGVHLSTLLNDDFRMI